MNIFNWLKALWQKDEAKVYAEFVNARSKAWSDIKRVISRIENETRKAEAYLQSLTSRKVQAKSVQTLINSTTAPVQTPPSTVV